MNGILLISFYYSSLDLSVSNWYFECNAIFHLDLEKSSLTTNYLSIIATGTIMMAVITKKRGKMSRKDALLEEAALGSVGIQQSHVVGIFALTFFFIFCCGLAGWKGLTWTLLLSVSLVLFGYLMKLTIDAGMNVPLGPDGEPLDNDSSDDEDDDEEEDGYKAPATVNSPTEKQAEKEAELPSFS